jgi:hypothetical protein
MEELFAGLNTLAHLDGLLANNAGNGSENPGVGKIQIGLSGLRSGRQKSRFPRRKLSPSHRDRARRILVRFLKFALRLPQLRASMVNRSLRSERRGLRGIDRCGLRLGAGDDGIELLLRNLLPGTERAAPGNVSLRLVIIGLGLAHAR